MKSRILFVSQRSPYSATFGSEQRSFYIRQALEQIGEVDVAVVNAEESQAALSAVSGVIPKVVSSFDLRAFPNDRLSKKLRWVFDPRVPYPHGNGVEVCSESRFGAMLKEYNLIWFSKLRTANLFRTWSWPRSVIDVDDVPSTFERSILMNGGSAGERFLTAVRFMSWRRRERLLGERFKVIAVCSEADQEYLGSLKVRAPIHVIPNGSEKPSREPVRNPAVPPRIGFVGLMEYYPNLEGVRWFLEKCWPKIKKSIPELRLRIAGKGSDSPLIPKMPDVDGLGWIPDLGEEISTWSLMIVPIRLGAGTRGKIAEGFGRKCPIVTTSLGVFGYEVTNGRETLLADTAEEYAAACIRAIRNAIEAEAMAENAYKKFLLHWTWEAISPQIWAVAEHCLRLSAECSTE